VLLTRSPLEYPQAGLSVRLACVKHAASVRPEPGSNSPLNAYRQTPKGHCQQNEETPNPTPKRQNQARSQSQTRANARKFETTKNNQSSTKKAHHHTGSKQPQHQTNGTDFRYAVEFSKNGHTPAAAFRPPWGQPCKHYPVRFAVSTACPGSPYRCPDGHAVAHSSRRTCWGLSLPRPDGTVAARLGEGYGHRLAKVKPPAGRAMSCPDRATGAAPGVSAGIDPRRS
jgi:hypothetical protein